MATVRRGTLVVLLVALVTIGLAVLAKARCGIPAGNEGDYLRWCYSDVPPLYYTEALDEGAVPYLDHPVEYPVLTGAVMWLAAAIGEGARGFVWATWALLAACGLGIAALLEREVGWRTTLAYAAAPTLAISAMVNWDLPAVLLASLGIVLHRRGTDLGSGVALGLGTAAKLFPALFVLPLALAAGRVRGTRAGIATIAGAVGAWLLVNLPIALTEPANWFTFFELSGARPSDWDALSTVVLDFTGWSVGTATLNLVLLAVFAAGYIALLVTAVRRDDPATWHLAALPLLAWFLLSSKVYSPQFSLWLLPLFALAFPGWRLWLAFGVADVAVTLTRFRYLANFVGDEGGLEGAWGQEPFHAALVVRAVLLVAVAWAGWRREVQRFETGRRFPPHVRHHHGPRLEAARA
ncbi:MAG TPA: glycosyltransferase 87 family protein [Nitriliruptorales bacterium]